MNLFYLPITVQVPESWQITSVEHIVFLEGPLPKPTSVREATIELQRQGKLTADSFTAFVKDMQTANEQSPELVQISPLKTIGKMITFGQRIMPAPPATMPADQAASALPPLYRWSTWVFVPSSDGGYDRYGLQFVDLDIDSYNANKDFLESIISSIAYNEKADADITNGSAIR